MEQAAVDQGALDGVRVLDFTAVMAGPVATRLLADLGADVIKIEPFTGDQVRVRPPLRDGHSAYFGHLNAGKRSVALDLKSPDAIALVKALVAQVDVVVENFRPGVMKRLGLNHEALSAINPRLIFCSISGYGQTGPKALDPAYAPVIHAASGFDATMLGYQDGSDRPANSAIFIADVLAGTYAFGAIQAALLHRQRTGKGQAIDVSLIESMLSLMVYETQEAQFPMATRRSLYSPLRTADGWLMIAPTSDRNFEQLCVAVGHPEWRQDPLFARNEDRYRNFNALLSLVEEHWSRGKTAAEAEAELAAAGVPCSRYRTLREVMADPHLIERGSFATVTDGAGSFKVTNPPFRMSGSRAEVRERVAELGADGAAVIAQVLGWSAERADELRVAGAMGGAD